MYNSKKVIICLFSNFLLLFLTHFVANQLILLLILVIKFSQIDIHYK